MDGWMDGWMDGGESRVKDCLQQSKTLKNEQWESDDQENKIKTT